MDNIDITIDSLKAQLIPQMKVALQTLSKSELNQFELSESKLPPVNSINFSPIEEISFKRSNGNEVKIGGDVAPPYSSFLFNNEKKLHNPNSPKVTFDVFDMKIKLPKIIKNCYKDVLNDPVAWAQQAEKYGADLITLHFVSTDPGIKDSSISKAAKLLEEVLQAVKIPIILGGSGNKKKDTALFETLGSMTEGERLMLSSADKITWDKIVPIAKKYGHNVLLWAQLDINDQTKLVEDALSMGMPRNRIVLDPTCATLGYGLEYSYSIYQKIRLAGLKGNKTLNFPLSAGTTNAWGGREAWMKQINHIPNGGGDRAMRGPLWEITTALTMSMVGMNLAMMLHPIAAQTFKEMVQEFYTSINNNPSNYLDWVSSNY